MKLSQLFVKTLKHAPLGEVSINAQLLLRAGFVYKEMAGVYTFLPMGLRVLRKIENIIRKHMDTIGVEVSMTALAPKENREKTKRIDSVDVLMKTGPANQASFGKCTNEYILNPTHEDMITPIVQSYVQSYKDLPVAVYQIQHKFRNEARAKSGLLRGREFRMKDLYSFHASQEDFDSYYEQAKQVYTNIFQDLGIGEKTYLTLASGGDFTEKFSHEFQTICDAGEDLIFIDEVNSIAYNLEVAPSKAPVYIYSKELLDMKDVFGENIKGVEELCEFLNHPIEACIKTMLFKDNQQKLFAAAVRGDYEVNEIKLEKVLGIKGLELLSDEEILQFTGAERGYAGVINLPKIFTLVCDDALESMTNFESGNNKTHYHTININWDRDLPKPEKFYDIKTAKTGDICPVSGEVYRVEKACEVGNIFPLETRFPDAFEFKYQNEKNESQQIIMGSYGIGPSRVMGVVVESHHDDKGMIWPRAIAPFEYVIIGIGDQGLIKAQEVYAKMQGLGYDVCFDDRDLGPGAKFKDADLIGYPFQIVIGNKTLEQGDFCEVTERKTGSKEMKLIESLYSL